MKRTNAGSKSHAQKRARDTSQPSPAALAAAAAAAQAAQAAANAKAVEAEAKAKADAAAKTRLLAAQQEEEATQKAKEAEEAKALAEQAKAAEEAAAAAAAIPKPGQKALITGVVQIPELNGIYCTVLDPRTVGREVKEGKLAVRLPPNVNGARTITGQELRGSMVILSAFNLTSVVSRTPIQPPVAASAASSSSSSSSSAAAASAVAAAKTATKTAAKTAKVASGPKVTTRGRAAAQGAAAAVSKTSKTSGISKPPKKIAARAAATTPAKQRASRTARAIAELSGGSAPVEDGPLTTRLAARSRAVIEYQGPRRTPRSGFEPSTRLDADQSQMREISPDRGICPLARSFARARCDLCPRARGAGAGYTVADLPLFPVGHWAHVPRVNDFGATYFSWCRIKVRRAPPWRCAPHTRMVM